MAPDILQQRPVLATVNLAAGSLLLFLAMNLVASWMLTGTGHASQAMRLLADHRGLAKFAGLVWLLSFPWTPKVRRVGLAAAPLVAWLYWVIDPPVPVYY